MTSPSDKTLPVQFEGSRMARRVLRVLGWRYDFEGLPALQGVLIAYPHTSNWDFPVAMLLKWAMGIEAKFWAKDSLFRIPCLAAGCAGLEACRCAEFPAKVWSSRWPL